jgi:hypothetical protein
VHAVLGPYTLSNVGDSESSSFAIIYSGGPRGASVAALLWGVREAMTRTRTTEVGPRLPLSTERIYPPIYSCLRISRLYGIGPWRVKTSSKANRERLRLTAQVEQLRWGRKVCGNAVELAQPHTHTHFQASGCTSRCVGDKRRTSSRGCKSLAMV